MFSFQATKIINTEAWFALKHNAAFEAAETKDFLPLYRLLDWCSIPSKTTLQQ